MEVKLWVIDLQHQNNAVIKLSVFLCTPQWQVATVACVSHSILLVQYLVVASFQTMRSHVGNVCASIVEPTLRVPAQNTGDPLV